MDVTRERVTAERRRLTDRADVVVPLVNDTRAALAESYGVTVESVTRDQYEAAIGDAFADADRGANVAALAGLLRELDAATDYPGFVVDDLLGRELAATIAGGQPLRFVAEATFHHADLLAADRSEEDAVGLDDLDAALAAGTQVRLPGWPWQAADSPFG